MGYEISETLAGGSSVAGGKGRIYAYFTADHTMKEKADFLKQEYRPFILSDLPCV